MRAEYYIAIKEWKNIFQESDEYVQKHAAIIHYKTSRFINRNELIKTVLKFINKNEHGVFMKMN